ncbi:phosphatidate cytidylyltransferase [Methylopila jiangsuensis]|uniref:Phosphatidate cytidylyltransferase n=1 Tax=Methylopila jiangsuensis TaxID=586230 RepID=A0A9W6N1Y8_9HYPH|nr:phosphatidate cytidylyltransferase [Methylopila jiangsuensis]MDR6285624.1 phosphatidate cytidylyltransferase [Methylopila jiangsuensis]GLK75384.1 phosphatidate cytidylyltransferase [Methylopila jiangsuensis]
MISSSSGDKRPSELTLRVLSGVVMAALALGVAWLGGPLFGLFWIAAGCAVGAEWAWLATPDPAARRRAAGAVAVALGVIGALYGASVGWGLGGLLWLAALALGAVGAGALARPAWGAGFGVLYGAAVFLGPLLLRTDPQDGMLALLWLFAVVWGTDIAAYASGRTFGGPKLAPRLSPKKTWSGALGGAILGPAAGVAVAAAGGVGHLAPVALVGLAAAVAVILGDLFESGAKRRYGAKDSGHLIPGHGGAMDRLDGFLVAATVAALIGLSRGGWDGAAQGLLRW